MAAPFLDLALEETGKPVDSLLWPPNALKGQPFVDTPEAVSRPRFAAGFAWCCLARYRICHVTCFDRIGACDDGTDRLTERHSPCG